MGTCPLTNGVHPYLWERSKRYGKERDGLLAVEREIIGAFLVF